MRLYTSTDPYNGWEYLLTVWPDGTHELATRRDGGATWGPPMTLMAQSSEVSS